MQTPSAFGRGGAAAVALSHVVASHLSPSLSSSTPPGSPAHSPRLRSTGRSTTSTTTSGSIMRSHSFKASKYGSPAGVTKPGSGLHHGRSGGLGGAGGLLHSSLLLQKVTQLFLSFFFRRHRMLLLVPLVYITGTLLYVGGDLSIADFPGRYRPGSVYRSHLVFQKLWPQMELAEADAIAVGVSDEVESGVLNDAFGGSHGRQVLSVWEYPKEGRGFTPCLSSIQQDAGLPESNGYILVEANGGLNQQRSTICNAVAVAKLLNATLIIPHFHLNSVWKDPSTFGEIFDEAFFISSLSQQVRVLRELPQEVLDRYENASMIYKIPKVQAWSLPKFYLEICLPQLLQRGVIKFTPFANRLAYDGVPKQIQKLRCYANFVALRFAQPIADLGEIVVNRMKSKSFRTNGHYVSIHLRFEEDMVAFSLCMYEGDKQEKDRLDFFRERSWRGKFTRIGRMDLSPQEIRRNGKCPLTPVEVGMMLRGMGFRSTTPIYLAAGKIYKGEASMEPLRRMFPYLQTKETLLKPEEYARFKGYSSRLAAIDYTVCLHSEVFVTTQGGNFPQVLMGHRRFLNKGHSKTIHPDKRRLVLLLDNPNIKWDVFRKSLVDMRRHSDFKGLQPRKSLPVPFASLFTSCPKQSLYQFPAPDCMCAEPGAAEKTADLTLVSQD